MPSKAGDQKKQVSTCNVSVREQSVAWRNVQSCNPATLRGLGLSSAGSKSGKWGSWEPRFDDLRLFSRGSARRFPNLGVFTSLPSPVVRSRYYLSKSPLDCLGRLFFAFIFAFLELGVD